MTFYNNIDPVLISAGPVEMRWYGLLFATGILLNYLLLQWVFKREKYPLEHLESLAVYLFFGLVIGARLGEVLFYTPGYFLENPIEILQIWKGGLSSHGATIGLFLAYFIWCRVHKVKFSKYTDALILGVPITAAFVRIGNFFNSEIVGKVTDGFGVVFQRNAESVARHPVQLYEAALSIVIFGGLFWLYKNYYKKTPPMTFMFAFLVAYFGGRFGLEFFKDLHGPLPESFPISIGQLLSILPFLAGVAFFVFFYPKLKKKR